MCKSGQNVAIECKLFFVHCKALTQNSSPSRGHIIKQKVSFAKVGHLKKTHALANISFFETHNFYLQFFSPCYKVNTCHMSQKKIQNFFSLCWRLKFDNIRVGHSLNSNLWLHLGVGICFENTPL
jgi:hypothetical protein